MTEFASALLANGTFVSSQAAAGTQFSRTAEQNRQKVLDHGEDAVLRDLHQLLKQPSAQASKVSQQSRPALVLILTPASA